MRVIPSERLKALLSIRQPEDDRPRRIPYPTLAQLLYESPSDYSEGRRCGNCYKFIMSGYCVEVAGQIRAEQVCGLHAAGIPQTSVPAVGSPMKKRDAVLVGLVDASQDGASCSACRFFTADEPSSEMGICAAAGAADGMPPVSVDALGACARWEHIG